MQRMIRFTSGLGLVALLIFACGKQTPASYPWLTEVDPSLHTSGKLVGYEFFAKW